MDMDEKYIELLLNKCIDYKNSKILFICYDVEIEDESKSIIDEMIYDEQLALLRRELAFIKSEYRNIIVAYYLENKSI